MAYKEFYPFYTAYADPILYLGEKEQDSKKLSDSIRREDPFFDRRKFS